MKRKRRRRRWVECARAILRLALLAAAVALLAPRSAHAQGHDIDVPSNLLVNPLYAPTSTYYNDSTYDRWWHEVADCEGVELPSFYVIVRYVQINYPYFDLPEDPSPPGSVTLGHAFAKEWQMFVAITHRFDEVVVKHEMAHFLLYWAHIANGGHPARYFDGHCGFAATYDPSPHKTALR